MTYKKNNPTWDGYMGDYLRGNVGINQLKPQHEFFDAIGLEKVLRENVQYEALISAEQAVEILEDIKPTGTRQQWRQGCYAERSQPAGKPVFNNF